MGHETSVIFSYAQITLPWRLCFWVVSRWKIHAFGFQVQGVDAHFPQKPWAVTCSPFAWRKYLIKIRSEYLHLIREQALCLRIPTPSSAHIEAWLLHSGAVKARTSTQIGFKKFFLKKP